MRGLHCGGAPFRPCGNDPSCGLRRKEPIREGRWVKGTRSAGFLHAPTAATFGTDGAKQAIGSMQQSHLGRIVYVVRHPLKEPGNGEGMTMTPQVKAKRGRPPFQPDNQTRKQIELMAAIGVSQNEIARALGINPKTLRLHCRRELERGLVLAEVEQAGNILRVASGKGAPALKAIMFALQSRFGWSHYAAALSGRQTDTSGRRADLATRPRREEPRSEHASDSTPQPNK